MVRFDPSTLRETKWHEYALRFLFGGAITAAAGVIGKEFGPRMGGLFLAFPAIFPASATLIEKNTTQKNHRAGTNAARRGRALARTDAAGAAQGSIGLALFAVLVWRLIPSHGPAFVLGGFAVAWFLLGRRVETSEGEEEDSAPCTHKRERQEITIPGAVGLAESI